jgi:hypothetical protein
MASLEDLCRRQGIQIVDERERNSRQQCVLAALKREKLDLELKLQDYDSISSELMFANKVRATA